ELLSGEQIPLPRLMIRILDHLLRFHRARVAEVTARIRYLFLNISECCNSAPTMMFAQACRRWLWQHCRRPGRVAQLSLQTRDRAATGCNHELVSWPVWHFES